MVLLALYMFASNFQVWTTVKSTLVFVMAHILLKLPAMILYHKLKVPSTHSALAGRPVYRNLCMSFALKWAKTPARSIKFFRPLEHCFCISAKYAAALSLPQCQEHYNVKGSLHCPRAIFTAGNDFAHVLTVEKNSPRAADLSCECM